MAWTFAKNREQQNSKKSAVSLNAEIKGRRGQKLKWNDVISKDLEELIMLQKWKQKALN